MDILFYYQSTVRIMQIRMLQLFKEKYFVAFNKFKMILLCHIVPKLQNISSATVIISALRVKF